MQLLFERSDSRKEVSSEQDLQDLPTTIGQPMKSKCPAVAEDIDVV